MSEQSSPPPARRLDAPLAEERFEQVIIEKQSLLLTGFLADSLLHEIKNEIQALDDFSSVLLSLVKRRGDDLGQLSAEEVARFRRSTTEIQGVARSLEKLVRLFRSLAGRPHQELVVLNDSVLRLVETLRPFADNHNVEIETDLGSDLPDLAVDPKLLEQSLLNIMINAIEQMSLAGVSERRLTITTRFLPEEDHPVLITLADTGPGISRAHQEKIFECFFTTKEKGSGLGLYISRIFIQRLGGRLRLKESPREGSTFEIGLPGEVPA